MCDALHYLLDNIFIRLGSKLYRKIVDILMGLFLFCYERDYMLSLSDNYQTDIIEADPDCYMAYLILIILILNKW